jgi:hypothetical protein
MTVKLGTVPVLLALMLFATLASLQATPILIDFEGLAEGAPATAVGPGPTVDVYLADGVTPASIAIMGEPMTAFPGWGGKDMASDPLGGVGFATNPDQNTVDGTYHIAFNGAIGYESLELDIYNYYWGDEDGGESITLDLFATSDWTGPVIGGATYFKQFATTGLGSDDDVIHLTATPGLAFGSARISMTAPDKGIGIDNIEFNTIPEPSSIVLFGTGLALVGLGVARRRRNRK